MEVLPIEVFGLHVEVPFATPQSFNDAALGAFGARLCHSKDGLELPSAQIHLKRWDDLFGFELSAQFLGGNATLTRTADCTRIHIRNGRTAGDWAIIRTALTRLFAILDPDPKTLSGLSAHAHARFPSASERDEWLEGFSHSPMVARPGVLGHVQIADWEKDIRVAIERSNVVDDGIFILWETYFTNDQEWETFLGSLTTMMENAANLFELGFEPLRERV